MHFTTRVALGAFALAVSVPSFGQTPTQTVPTTGTSVTVVAQKEPADPAKLPVSVTALPEDLLKAAGVTFISDAEMFSPNTHFTEFTARKLSNPRIRGVGASPANPGVVTYVDGVPQLNANTTSFDLIGVDQVEFVRGPQSALFGRNALGGVINIQSTRPSMTDWSGNAQVPFGSYSDFGVRAGVDGPIVKDKLSVAGAVAYGNRDGFTTNVVNDEDVDFRNGTFAKGQLLWTPTKTWEARVIVSGERARDGDYALNDLNAVRSTPFEVQRDFTGHTDRDIVSTTILASHKGPNLTFSNVMGVVNWKTFDATDLDYSAMPLATRNNQEEATQFTDEVRVASGPSFQLNLGGNRTFRWQAGTLFFTQGYDQTSVNNFAPFVLSPFVGVPVTQTSPQASLDDFGVGVYGQGTVAFGNRVDVSAGVRYDHERREANITTSFAPPIAPGTFLDQTRNFNDVSPQVAVAVKLHEGAIAYGTASRAFKAGGFNPVSIPGSESYDEEHAWNFEGGVKMQAHHGRVVATLAVFSINWDDLQLNVPVPGAPGQFFIDNVGSATSYGVEYEGRYHVMEGLDAFAAIGSTHARFDSGSMSGGIDVAGNKIPNTPSFTTAFGGQYSYPLGPFKLYARADVATTGSFQYDEANTQGQSAYTLTNLRGGFHGQTFSVEAWVRNAFDTRYVPLAFPYPGFSPSGFIGEPGRPRTWGVNIGIGF
jgi:iron complex outermembrane receptor protein